MPRDALSNIMKDKGSSRRQHHKQHQLITGEADLTSASFKKLHIITVRYNFLLSHIDRFR